MPAGSARLNSIGKKLLLSLALPIAGLTLLGLASIWQFTDFRLRRTNEDEARALGQYVASSFTQVDATDRGLPARQAHRAVTFTIHSNWRLLRGISKVRIVGADGTIRWSRDIEEEDHPLRDAPRLLGVASEQVEFESEAEEPTRPLRGEVVLPLGGVACAGCHASALKTGALQLVIDETGLRREVSRVFLRSAWAALALGLLLVLVITLILKRVVTRPLRRLIRSMQQAEAGDFLVRVPVTTRDEMGVLAETFNRMLARITSLKADELETQADLTAARRELELKGEIERTNAVLEERVEQLSILFELARALTSTLQLDEILQRISDLVPARLGVPKFSVMLVNERGELEIRKARPPRNEGLVFSAHEGICGKAASTKRVVYVADLEKDPLFKEKPGHSERHPGSMLSAPMIHGGQVLGVMNFERLEPAGISPDEIEFLTAVADQVAVAIQNARLHTQTVALSLTDPLTGLSNRRHLIQQVEAELARAARYETPVSVLMIDIDHFKSLNDTNGHAAGDAVLRDVSAVLKKQLRRVDALARYGGEEFVVVLPQVATREAGEVAEKLRKAIEEHPFPYSRAPQEPVTISIGVSTFPLHGQTVELLVDAADAALYQSKRRGRNCVSEYQVGMESHPGRKRGPGGV